MNLLLTGFLLGIGATFVGSLLALWVLIKIGDRAALRAQRSPAGPRQVWP